MKTIIPLLILSLLPWTANATRPQTAKASRPCDTTVIAHEQRDGYECLLIEYHVSDTESVRSYLLVPDDATPDTPKPGLVLLHDHGARFDIGKEKLVRPAASAPEHIRISSAQWIRDNFDGIYFADSLAALGYVVIVPDMLYWGSRSSDACRQWSQLKFTPQETACTPETGKPLLDSLKKEIYEGQRTVYDSLCAAGTVWAEKTLKEDAMAAELLSELDFVDSTAIAAFGWSMGAHRAWLLTAYSPAVRAGVSLCWMTLKETLPTPYKASDYAMLIPRLREKYDFPDIALKLVPKPYLFLNGMKDKLFPADAVEKAFDRMQSIYSDHGAEGLLRTEFFEGGHHCGRQVQAVIVDFLQKTVPLHE